MSVTGSCPPPERGEPVARQAAAACAGPPAGVVFSKRGKEAAPALRACAGCLARCECEEAVAPADNWFDGVCGERLWHRGHPVETPVPLLPLLRSGLSGGSVA
jgi:WhiB family redox-sensing transcriptional regulator